MVYVLVFEVVITVCVVAFKVVFAVCVVAFKVVFTVCAVAFEVLLEEDITVVVGCGVSVLAVFVER